MIMLNSQSQKLPLSRNVSHIQNYTAEMSPHHKAKIQTFLQNKTKWSSRHLVEHNVLSSTGTTNPLGKQGFKR